MKKKIFALVFTILIIGLSYAVLKYERNNSAKDEEQEVIEYKGKSYIPKNNLTTVLLYGVDKDNEYIEENDATFSIGNYEQADFVNIIMIDEETNNAKVIKINRDSMFKTSVISDNYISDYIQIALAHTLGTGGSDSAVNLMSAVSSIFDDYIYLNNYIKIPYDIVRVATDAIGGVELEVIQNMTNVDERLIRGEKVKLDGKLAETYVRARMGLEDDSNKARMRRQTQFITEFLREYKSRKSISLDKFTDVAEMIHSNMSIAHIQNIIENVNLDTIEFYDLDGYSSRGPQFIEFNIDHDTALDLIFEIYYQQVTN